MQTRYYTMPLQDYYLYGIGYSADKSAPLNAFPLPLAMGALTRTERSEKVPLYKGGLWGNVNTAPTKTKKTTSCRLPFCGS